MTGFTTGVEAPWRDVRISTVERVIVSFHFKGGPSAADRIRVAQPVTLIRNPLATGYGTGTMANQLLHFALVLETDLHLSLVFTTTSNG